MITTPPQVGLRPCQRSQAIVRERLVEGEHLVDAVIETTVNGCVDCDCACSGCVAIGFGWTHEHPRVPDGNWGFDLRPDLTASDAERLARLIGKRLVAARAALETKDAKRVSLLRDDDLSPTIALIAVLVLLSAAAAVVLPQLFDSTENASPRRPSTPVSLTRR